MTEFNPIIKAASEDAKLGDRLLPVSSNKIPLISSWSKEATSNQDIISGWFQKWPSMNIGVLTGHANIVVLDVDPRNGGDKSLEQLELKFGKLPPTPTVRTSNGGFHKWYKHDKPFRKAKLAAGIDIKADGGMVLLPPSRHPSGIFYAWEDGFGVDDLPLAQLPEWVFSGENDISGTLPDEPSDVEGSHRNPFIFARANEMSKSGISEQDLLANLWALNIEHCKPELPKSEIDEIAKRCIEFRKNAPSNTDTGPYQIQSGVFCRLVKDDDDDYKLVPLTNFDARIVTEETHDNGRDKTLSFVIEGKLANGEKLNEVRIPAAEYASNWFIRLWGASAITTVGNLNTDHIRTAMQHFSTNRKKVTVYTHTGLREISGKLCFLHSGGAITADGMDDSITVDLGEIGAGCNYYLPPPPTGDECIEAVRASLQILSLTDLQISLPLLLSAFCGPLSDILPVGFTIHLVGMTGTFKSELYGLVLSHFVDGACGRKLTGSWDATGNYLQKCAFMLKNVLFVVDDFCPKGSSGDVQRQHREADRFLRGQGNGLGRGRMSADGSLRPTFYSRAMVGSTGEDSPKGQSIRARLLILEISKGEVDSAKLTISQRNAQSGLHGKAMSRFIQWILANYELLQSKLPARHKILREEVLDKKQHRRTPDIIAHLGLTWEVFLDFAVEVSAVTEEERKTLWESGWASLGAAAKLQSDFQEAEDPAVTFLELMRAGFIGGDHHLANFCGPNDAPKNAEDWGWRQGGTEPCKDGYKTAYRANGSKIGWISDTEIYLDPAATFVSLKAIAAARGNDIGLTERTYWKRLREANVILPSKNEPGKNLTRITDPNNSRERPRVVRILITPDLNLSGRRPDQEVRPVLEVPGTRPAPTFVPPVVRTGTAAANTYTQAQNDPEVVPLKDAKPVNGAGSENGLQH